MTLWIQNHLALLTTGAAQHLAFKGALGSVRPLKNIEVHLKPKTRRLPQYVAVTSGDMDLKKQRESLTPHKILEKFPTPTSTSAMRSALLKKCAKGKGRAAILLACWTLQFIDM
jgi:hypothetical protein